MATYKQALYIVDILTAGLAGSNIEYERGQLELIADLFGYQGASDMEAATERITADIRALA